MKKGFTPKGFTIIELVVVIAIIAILAAIVMINVSGYINKAKDTAAIANIDTIIKEAYLIQTEGVSYNFGKSWFANSKTTIENLGFLFYFNNGPDLTSFNICINLKSVSASMCMDDSGYRKQTNTNCDNRFQTNANPPYNTCKDGI